MSGIYQEIWGLLTVYNMILNSVNTFNSYYEENVMTQYVKRTQCDYSLSFKLAFVGQVEKGEMTSRKAQDRYGIQGSDTVKTWLRKFGQPDWHSSSPVRKSGVNMPEMPLTPEQRIKELEPQLAESEIKAQFFEAVVKIMNTEFGATLTKKQLATLSRNHKRADSH